MNNETLEKERNTHLPVPISIDMSGLYSLVRAARETPPALPPVPGRVHLCSIGSHLGADLTLFGTAARQRELYLQRQTTARLPACIPRLRPLQVNPALVSLRQIDHEKYHVVIAKPHAGSRSFEFDIPCGIPRSINVATLKAMVGAGSNDVVFRKYVDQEHWEVCPDNYPVDLEDRTQVFKIREWAILS